MKLNSKFIGIILSALVLFVSPDCPVFADDVTDGRIEKLEAALKQMQKELDALKAEHKAAQSVKQEQVEVVVTKTPEDKVPSENIPGWISKIKFSGDFRYRHESINRESGRDFISGNNRHRIRARLGISIDINEYLDVYFRLATGSEIPTSTNQTLTDSFSTKDFLLDRAYLDWHPQGEEHVNIYAGKMKNPFFRPDNTGLIWDSDVNPEGIAGRYYHDIDEARKLIFNGGGFWVDKDFPNEDIFLWAIQGYYDHKIDKKSFFRGGISYYDYGNIQGKQALQSTFTPDLPVNQGFQGNTSEDGVYVFDYNTIELFAEYGFEAFQYPATVFYDYVKNPAAQTHKSTGYLAGCRLNRAVEKGTWQMRYSYRELAPDCVVAVFADADSGGGGTDLMGHKISYDYMLTKNVMASLLYFINEVGPDNQDYNKLQADINIKF